MSYIAYIIRRILNEEAKYKRQVLLLCVLFVGIIFNIAIAVLFMINFFKAIN